MGQVFKSIVIQTTEESIMILVSLSGLLFLILLSYWYYNRKKFQKLTHQIPASVVKSYLDSVIQNSTALKSTLFRGGGLELGSGIPAVVPVGQLPTGNLAGEEGQESAQRNAEMSRLKSDAIIKDKTIADLTEQLDAARENAGDKNLGIELSGLKKEIEKLEKDLASKEEQLNALRAGDDTGKELGEELRTIAKERDEFKERLQEYEIIADDLANLKRFQEENAHLRKMIEELGGTPPEPMVTPAHENAPKETPAPAADEVQPVPEPEETGQEREAAPEGEPKEPSDEEPEEKKAKAESIEDKGSTEELLKEFEKMLG